MQRVYRRAWEARIARIRGVGVIPGEASTRIAVWPYRNPLQRAAHNFEALRLAAHVRRQELGLSLTQAVARTRLAESTVTSAFYGYHEGSVRTWWSIAHALGMPIGDLLNHLDDVGTTNAVPPLVTVIE